MSLVIIVVSGVFIGMVLALLCGIGCALAVLALLFGLPALALYNASLAVFAVVIAGLRVVPLKLLPSTKPSVLLCSLASDLSWVPINSLAWAVVLRVPRVKANSAVLVRFMVEAPVLSFFIAVLFCDTAVWLRLERGEPGVG